MKRILISDEQQIKAGDVLIELDAIAALADKDRVQGDLAVARLQIVRGQAVLAVIDKGQAWPCRWRSRPASGA